MMTLDLSYEREGAGDIRAKDTMMDGGKTKHIVLQTNRTDHDLQLLRPSNISSPKKTIRSVHATRNR